MLLCMALRSSEVAQGSTKSLAPQYFASVTVISDTSGKTVLLEKPFLVQGNVIGELDSPLVRRAMVVTRPVISADYITHVSL